MVISEELRVALYPLGLISTLAFTLRFLVQWLVSERAHKSVVMPSFWWISLLGNASLLIHALIQGQYFICLAQGVHGVIAGRNLNLMQPKAHQWKLSTVIFQLLGTSGLITFLFAYFSGEAWMRIPVHTFQGSMISLSWTFHLIGILGIVLFASRFWVQWIHAERHHASTLERPFWWLSLTGAFLSLIYFGMIQDYINLVGPLFGMIPYCRNLILIRKSAHANR